MIMAYLGNSIGLFIFALSKVYWIQCFSRLLSGFCQIFQSIYHPLFVDAFGTEKSKSYMLSMMLLSPPLGVIFGYLFTYAMLKNYSWQIGFIGMGFYMATCALLLIFVSK
jgi:hypothetical protein